MTLESILVCTVGGSHEPIVTMIKSRDWAHVIFVCTPDLPDKPGGGSVVTITDRVVIRARNGEADTVLPSIPAQAGLAPEKWEAVVAPPDDPDAIVALLAPLLARIKARFPAAAIVADYTGGTKSMSAGLMLAAIGQAGVSLQVTTGQRNDLKGVQDGTQQPKRLATDRILIQRQVELLTKIWAGYGYQEAADGFESLWRDVKKWPGRPDELVGQLRFWHKIGHACAAWDKFDHKTAYNFFNAQRKLLPASLRELFDITKLLKDGSVSALTLFDLLRNAERRAARGRYDDAVARLYRLWESSVQWLLWTECGVDTARVDGAGLPPEIIAGQQPNSKTGLFKLGSARSWMLFRHLKPDSAASQFWNADADGKTNDEQYRNHGNIRNESILAHGRRPIEQDDWQKIHQWTAGPFMTMIAGEARRLGQRWEVPQLPTDLPQPTATSL